MNQERENLCVCGGGGELGENLKIGRIIRCTFIWGLPGGNLMLIFVDKYNLP
jgi:hypothetical protein